MQKKAGSDCCRLPALDLADYSDLGIKPATAGGSSLSGAAEADAHLAVFHQHRHPAIARGEALHLLHGLGTLDHILINYGKTLFALGLPGLEGEGSGLLAEDGDFLSHDPPPYLESRK